MIFVVHFNIRYSEINLKEIEMLHLTHNQSVEKKGFVFIKHCHYCDIHTDIQKFKQIYTQVDNKCIKFISLL